MTRERIGPVPRFVGAALAALAVLATVYVAFVQTEPGQRIENLALSGATLHDPNEIEGSLANLSQISVLSFGVAIVVVALVAAVRGRMTLALVSGAVMGLSAVLAEILKEVLPRPQLVEAPRWLLANSFPSGHATIAVSIGIGALIVAPNRVRWLLLPISATYAAVIAQAVQIAGWHRLSGTLGGALLVLSVASIALAALAARGRVHRSMGGRIDPRVWRIIIVFASAAVGAGALVAVLPSVFPTLHAPPGADGAFAHTAMDLFGVGFTITTLVVFAALIDPYTLGRGPGPPAGTDAPPASAR